MFYKFNMHLHFKTGETGTRIRGHKFLIVIGSPLRVYLWYLLQMHSKIVSNCYYKCNTISIFKPISRQVTRLAHRLLRAHYKIIYNACCKGIPQFLQPCHYKCCGSSVCTVISRSLTPYNFYPLQTYLKTISCRH